MCKLKKKLTILVGCQGLTPVILSAWETEMRKIAVQCQLWANSPRETLSQKYPIQKKGLAERLKQ
jgi:hypothetical protein